MNMHTIDRIALVLVVVGALNWGLVGLFRFDLVASLVGLTFGQVNDISALVYVLVALSGVLVVRHLARPLLALPSRSAHSA